MDISSSPTDLGTVIANLKNPKSTDSVIIPVQNIQKAIRRNPGNPAVKSGVIHLLEVMEEVDDEVGVFTDIYDECYMWSRVLVG